MSWAQRYPALWAEVMQDGHCGWCKDNRRPGRWARVFFLVGEGAVWASACRRHRTRLELAA